MLFANLRKKKQRMVVEQEPLNVLYFQLALKKERLKKIEEVCSEAPFVLDNAKASIAELEAKINKIHAEIEKTAIDLSDRLNQLYEDQK